MAPARSLVHLCLYHERPDLSLANFKEVALAVAARGAAGHPCQEVTVGWVRPHDKAQARSFAEEHGVKDIMLVDG